MAGSGVRTRRAAEWARRLARQAASGRTVAEFCAEEGISVASFYYQRQKRRGDAAPRAAARGSAEQRRRPQPTTSANAPDSPAVNGRLFRPLQVTSSLVVTPHVTVRLPGGAELTLARDPELLRQVLEQLLSAAPATAGGRSC